jgi:predicted ATPase
MASAATGGAGGDLDGFVGREQELGELGRLAGANRLVTLCGPAGIGKTRLLHALLTALAPGFPDGTYVIRLADLAQPDLLVSRVAATLGVAEEPTADLAETLAQALSGRRLVLALDGYDQLASACAGLCERLLNRLPDPLLVAAGREPLRVPGEAAWLVPALALPAAGEDDPGRAAAADAVRLFVSRGAAHGLALDAGNCAAVVAACRAAGGVPLALELAAARLPELGAAKVAAGLSGPPEPGGPGIPAPAEAMSAVIGWSYDQLTPAEQVMLRRLSASPSWTLEMAEQVCAGDDLPAAGCGGLLARLAGRAMLQESGRPAQGRWRVPGAIGEDAAVRLAKAGETELLSRRVRDYAERRAEYLVAIANARVPVTSPVAAQLFEDYNTNARNVRAALTWCLEHGDAAGGLRICTEFGIYWIAAGAPGEGVRWLSAFSRFLDGGEPALPAAVRGPALVVRGLHAHRCGDLPGAQAWATAGLALCRAAPDLHYAAIALNVLAETAIAEGHPEDALPFTAEALELARPVWDAFSRVFALNVRSQALTAVGRPGEARESASAALALALEIGHHYGAADARRRVGEAALAAGDLDAARDSLLAALPYLRISMPQSDAVSCLISLGLIALRQGDPSGGREYLAESLRIVLRTGSRAGIADTLLAFAELARAEGRPARALQLTAAAAAQRAAVRLPPPEQAQRYRAAAPDLGEAQVARLWADGLRLTSSAAARLALAPE